MQEPSSSQAVNESLDSIHIKQEWQHAQKMTQISNLSLIGWSAHNGKCLLRTAQLPNVLGLMEEFENSRWYTVPRLGVTLQKPLPLAAGAPKSLHQ